MNDNQDERRCACDFNPDAWIACFEVSPDKYFGYPREAFIKMRCDGPEPDAVELAVHRAMVVEAHGPIVAEQCWRGPPLGECLACGGRRRQPKEDDDE